MRLTLEHLYKLPWESGVTWYPLGLGVVTLLIYLLLQRRLRFLPNVALTLVLASFAHAFFTGFPGFENHVCGDAKVHGSGCRLPGPSLA